MSKIKKLLLGISVFFCVVPSFATTLTVTDEASFLNALSSDTVDKIVIDGSVEINADGTGDNALVIDRELVITGGELSLRRAGIVLGADVTFENITLSFINLVRNGIFANGNTLILNNVENGNSNSTSIHLFCGGVTQYNGTNILPITQNDGQIIISGNNQLGNIFAGSLCDVDNKTNSYTGNSTIIINQETTGTIGNIYASGAYESRGEMQGDLLYPSSESFKVLGKVELHLKQAKTIDFDGNTGFGGAKLIYNNEDMSVCMPTLKNISALEIKAGHLAPKTTSNFIDSNAKVSVASNARIELVNFANELTISEFEGGGELVLGQNQTLTISGDVTGDTSVGIGSIFNNTSQQMPVEGYTYIKVLNADNESYNFTLIPYTNEILELDDNGNWYATFPDESIVVIDASVSETTILPIGTTSASIPVFVTYKTDDWYNMLFYVPVLISINGNDAIIKGDEDEGFEYTVSEDIGIELGYFTYDDTDKLVLLGFGENEVIPEGTYNINMTIPKEYMQNDEDKVLTTKLIIKDKNSLIAIDIPSAKADIKYTGEEQVGVLEREGYTLEGHKATNAGSYQAIAKLNEGYCWSDTTTENKTIDWEISKVDGRASVTITDWEFGKEVNQPSASSDTNGVENITYYYKVYGAEDDTYVETIPTEIGKYTLKAIFAETDNYNEVIVYADFNINSGHTHSGGEANCILSPICDVCGESYGEKDSNKHTGGTEIRNAITATTSNKGYTGDTYCKGCDNLISLGKEIPQKTSTSGGSGGGGGGSSKKEENIIKVDANKEQIIANPNATIKNKEAEIEITQNIGKELVKQAVKSDSKLVVIEPIIKKEVNNIEMSIPASTLDSIARENDLRLAIVTSFGIVEIGKEELKNLSEYGKIVSINIENNDNKINLEIKADDKHLLNIEGDIKVTIPSEKCNIGTVVAIVDANGTKKVLPKTISNIETSEVTVYINGTSTLEIIDNEKTFEDIKESDWYKNAVGFASARNLFNGTSEKEFSPNLSMSRAMIAQVLYNLENNPEHSATSNFKDISDVAWYAKAVNWAVNEEIITGYGNGLYGPNDTLTREQLAVMLWKYSGKPESTHEVEHFSDVQEVSEYAEQAIKWSNENKIINGDDKGKLNPKGNATRAQVAQIFKNFMDNLK